MTSLRVLALAVAAACAVPLMGAISNLPPPVVVVFPLTASGGADPEAGASIAVVMAQRLAAGGGIVVKPYPPGTQRVDYLKAARALGADYYVSGFLTPLGEQISMVSQVVSVSSGTVISSTSAFVRTYADAAAQAEPLHDAILHHAGRALASLDAPRETPAPKPSEKNEANISGLFKRKKKAAPTPTPSAAETSLATTASAAPRVARATATPTKPPVAATRKPEARATPVPRPAPTARPTAAPAPLPIVSEKPVARARPNASALAKLNLAASILVLQVAGDADPALANYAQDALIGAVGRSGTTVAGLPADPADLPARAREFCALAFGSKTLYAPTLTFDRDRNGAATDVELDVLSYDCGGNPTGRQHARARIGNRGAQGAVDRVAADAIGAFAFATQSR